MWSWIAVFTEWEGRLCRYLSMGAPFVGVISAPEVAAVLRRFGFKVVDGVDPRKTATDISQLMRAEGQFPLVIADTEGTAVLRQWAISMSERTRVAVLGAADGIGILDGQPQRLPLPATVNDLFTALRYATTSRPEGSFVIAADLRVGEPSAQRTPDLEVPLPDDLPDDAVEFGVPGPESTPEPVAAPVASDPFPDDMFISNANTTQQVEQIDRIQTPEDEPEPQYEIPDVQLDYAPQPVALPEHEQSDIHHAPAPAPAPALTPTVQHEPTVPAQQPVQVDDFFERRAAATTAAPVAPPRQGGAKGQVVVVAAAKGGVGKSSTSILLAEVASRAGMRAVLVDANRGQADIRKYLRLTAGTTIPTVYDAYTKRDPAAAIATPSVFGPFRQAARLDVPDYAIVLGPPAELADPGYASAAVYSAVVEHARTIADLVIIDTQIIEASRTDLWEDFLLPQLRSGGWLVSITDETSPGVSNLLDRLGELADAGNPASSTIVIATRYSDFTDEDSMYFQTKFSRLGTFVAATGNDETFRDQMNMGRILADSPMVEPAIRAILNRITGRTDLFAPRPATDGEPKRRLFGRGGRR